MQSRKSIAMILFLALISLTGCMDPSSVGPKPISSEKPDYRRVRHLAEWHKAVAHYIMEDARRAYYLEDAKAWVLNRKSIRAVISKESMELRSETGPALQLGSSWQLAMAEPQLVGHGQSHRVKFDEINATGKAISLHATGTMTQTWTNGRYALEQDFEIFEDMGSEFQLRIWLKTDLDWHVDSHGLYALKDNKVVLTATAPKAFDSHGLEIPASFGRMGDRLTISVRDVRHYPVFIDPAWQATGQGSQSSWFGWKVEAAGDINKDGFDDVVVSAPFFNTGNQSAGKIYLYYGNSQGLSDTPAWSSSGDGSNRALFGWAVSSGDFNGDGYSDLAVGAPSRADTGDTVGKAFMFPGSFNGPLPPAWTSSGDAQQGTFFGTSISSAGDINGDGFDDLLVGAPAASISGGASSLPGKAFLFYGSPSGLSSSPAWTSSGDGQAGSGFGWSVAGAGDVNADGYDDLAIGASLYDMTYTDTGRVFLYTGSQSSPGSSALWAESGDVQKGAQFGWSISAGSIDADGYSDLLVGAPGHDAPAASAGRVYAYRGGDINTGLSPSYWWVNSGDGHTGAQFGWSVAVAGDVNDDGYGEVLAGAPGDSTAGNGAGKIWLFDGSPAGPLQPASFTSLGDEQTGAGFGGAVAAAGDVNNDGAADFLVGAYLMDSGGTDTGAAYLFLGTPGGGPGVCEPEGAACDDHDDCTSADTCDTNGQCHGTPFSCDDQNPCTDDICRPDGTCSFLHNTNPCDDNDACTSPDVCSAAECHGLPIDCSWLDDQCNQGACDPSSGQCRPTPVADGTPCDDGDSCTKDEACSGGVCIQGSYICDSDSGCGCNTGHAGSDVYLLLVFLMLGRWLTER